MEKQNKLVIEILRRLDDAGILPNILLVGSWCAKSSHPWANMFVLFLAYLYANDVL